MVIKFFNILPDFSANIYIYTITFANNLFYLFTPCKQLFFNISHTPLPSRKNNSPSLTHYRNVFLFISIAQWNVEANETIISKVAKGKGTARGESRKTGKCSEEQDNEPTCSFQNYDSRRLLMFLYQGWYLHKGKETPYLTSSVANFG